MAIWSCSEEAIRTLEQMAEKLNDCSENLGREIECLENIFQENYYGLGSHRETIHKVMSDIHALLEGAQKNISLLVIKLNKAAIIRQMVLQNNIYSSTEANTNTYQKLGLREDGRYLAKERYTKSDIGLLKGTENFSSFAIQHIFEGTIKKRGGGGYHYEGVEGSAGCVIKGTEMLLNDKGVYKAQVEIGGAPKLANGGYSTFFPKDMTPQAVIDVINEAYDNKKFCEGTRSIYIGVASNGLVIEMYIDANGKIISAFPKE